MMSVSDEISWYHPKITREEGEKLLLSDPKKVNGLFIVRDSVSSPSDYVLSVLCNNEVHNYQIRRHQEDAFFSIRRYLESPGSEHICTSTEEKRQYVIAGYIFPPPFISFNNLSSMVSPSSSLSPNHFPYELVKCHGLENLIDFYKKNTLSDDGLVLTDHIRGTQPPPETRRYGSTNLLHRATDVGHYRVVTELLQSGYPGFDAKNQDGKTAAHLAAINGQNDILRELISYQVNVNFRDASGVTPLHYASKYNRPDTVRLLVVLGKANLQARNTENGEVPLHVAASEGHIEVIKVLLSLNAPVNPRTNSNAVPAELARRKGHVECAEFLESYTCPTPKTSRHRFYHGTLDRHEAEEKIKKINPQSGVFLVRYSERNNVYILTLFHEKVWHYIIREQGNFMFIDNGPLLNSLEHLVEHYGTLPDGLPTVLTHPVPPPPKPDAPPISTLKKNKPRNIRPKLRVPQTPDSLNNEVTASNVFQNIVFTSDICLANNNNIHKDQEDELIPSERLKRGTLIGEGEFASVFEGLFLRQNGEEVRVAIKMLRNEQLESNKENFRREAEVMTNLKHHCIVKLLGICIGPPLQMVQELVPLGSILQYIDSHHSEINPNLEFKIWAAQIACGMHYLEENRFVHRDLAARNILLSSKLQAKISDFGLSRALHTNQYYSSLTGGRWPLKWYAPESYNFGHFDHKSDVWSFGVTIWEMYSFGAYPYGDMKGAEAIVLIDKGQRLQKPDACPDNVYNEMLKCWAFDKDERPTFKELLQFFQADSEYINLGELIPEANLP